METFDMEPAPADPAWEKVPRPPNYVVKTVFSWRTFKKVLRFDFNDAHGIPRRFYIELYLKDDAAPNERLRFNFWLPWTSREDSAEVYKQGKEYAIIVFHYMAAMFVDMAEKTKPNG